ncbi:unnamed protein product [Ascophyllum nodosum]
MFQSLEQVLLLFRRRKQTAFFRQVKAGVEAMCGRSFTTHHLAQILFVQPDAYKVSSKTDSRPIRGGYRLRDLFIEFGEAEDPIEASPRSRESGRIEHERRVGGKTGDEKERGASFDGPGGTGIESVSSQRREKFRRMLLAASARHCKCAADRERQSTFCECSCLPGAPLPDISPLRVEGNPCLSPSGIRLSTSAGTKALSHIRGLLESGGVTRDGGESEGSDAPKNLDALRKQLRQKDMLRSGVSEYHSLISFGHRAASHGMFFAFHTRSLWRFSSLEVEIFCRK